MGYTHYWYRTNKSHPKKKWTEFVSDCRELLNNLPKDVVLGGAFGDTKKPVFSNTEIVFNGYGDLAHETFFLSQPAGSQTKLERMRMEHKFGFCKTAQKPYDCMVTACLILYKYHFGKDVEIASDGDWDDWKDGIALVVNSFPNGKEIVVQMKLGEELFERCLNKSA